jgi:hypothetical protein
MSKHPLECPKCQDYRSLFFHKVSEDKDGKSVGINIPFFKCPNCGKKDCLRPEKYFTDIIEESLKKLNKGEFRTIEFSYEKEKFNRFKRLDFKYSSEDYYLIPGLYRPDDPGYLCPVFFDKDILLYYNNHPDYSVHLDSFSSGNIYYKNESFLNYGFGINRNGKIFTWLGDLYEDFSGPDMVPHLKRFQASNIDSDHDIYSKFYLSQNAFSEEDAFQESDNEVQIFTLKEELDNIILKKHLFPLTRIEISDLFDHYKPPILVEKDQIFNAYVSLNKLIVENIQLQKLKQILVNAGLNKKTIKGLGSLKTLEKFLIEILKIKDVPNLISPLYVLNDLRQLQGHLTDSSFDEKYNFCKQRLGLNLDSNHFIVYQELIRMLIEFYEETIERIKASG